MITQIRVKDTGRYYTQNVCATHTDNGQQQQSQMETLILC